MNIKELDATVLKVTKKVVSKKTKAANTPETVLKNMMEK
jgi:hypothetical protein